VSESHDSQIKSGFISPPDKIEEILKSIKKFVQQKDMLLKQFGMKIEELKPGYSIVSMKVRKEHLNAAEVCHGGVIFSLADVAFALASNSHGTLALAMDMSISYIRSVLPGETIKAVCTEKHLGKSTGMYIIEIFDSRKRLTAFVKATVFRKGTPLLQ